MFDSRVVDDNTPISADGGTYRALQEWPELHAHVLRIKEMLGEGKDPWAEENENSSDAPLLRQLLELALARASGRMLLEHDDGEINITIKDGKLISVTTNIESLEIGKFLLSEGLCDEASLAQAQASAPQMGGDVGGALIALGLVQPHEYFEKFIAWASQTLGRALIMDLLRVEFVAEAVQNPPVPLGFDRLGVFMQLVRTGVSKTALAEHLEHRRSCPVIMSQVEGLELEHLKLKPKELRVIKNINGVKTLGVLQEDLGGSEEKNQSLMRTIFLAEQSGLVVFGEDPMLRREEAEAVKVRDLNTQMRKQNFFEIFDIQHTASDDELRTKYTDYAKSYHPDKLRADAHPKLLEARRALFATISEAFNAIETEDQRYQYQHDLDTGAVGSSADLEKVQNTLQAETLFKKAEVMVKVRKYSEAMELLSEAVSLNPDDIEFRIYRAYVAYLLASKKGGDENAAEGAIKRILTLMKKNANIASGYLFLGHLHKAVGKNNIAVKYYQKVLEYDESHPDATREVRLANMRNQKKKKRRFF